MQTARASGIHEAATAIRQGTLTAEELVASCLDAIETYNGQLNALLCIRAKEALEEARACDIETAGGRSRGPLHGIALVVKDNIDVRGMPTTVGSPLFAHTADARIDAPVIAKLRQAGAIILGKSNMDELAAHISGGTSCFGATCNPWQLEKKLSPGGSSGGTAAATAAGLCLGGLGTDTGGSVRVPAGWCGLCGIRPTYGHIDMAGVYPRSRSLDVVGPIGRCARDAQILLQAIAGDILAEALHTPSAVRLCDLRIGFFPGMYGDTSAEVGAVYRSIVSRYAEMGAHCVPVELSLLDDPAVVDTLNSIRSFEFARDIAGDIQGNSGALQMHPVPLADYRRGQVVSQKMYETAQRHMKLLGAGVHEAFSRLRIHLFLLPAAQFTAPPGNADAETFTAGRRLVNLFSLTQVPTVVFCGGLAENGLPVGMQLVGPCLSERLLLDAADAYEGIHGGFQPPW